MPAAKKVSPTDAALMRVLLRTGQMTKAQIAREFGVAAATVYRHTEEAGMEAHKNYNRKYKQRKRTGSPSTNQTQTMPFYKEVDF